MPKEADPKALDRRKFASSVSASLLLLPSSATLAAAAVVTPRQTDGPFYPDRKDRFSDVDNDLVLISSKTREAGGTILHLGGTVLDANGHPLTGQIVEIWQCDINGRYLSHKDWSLRRSRDTYFQGFGSAHTSSNGHYRFRTIKPVPYTGRTPHIHVKVRGTSGETHTTQMYLAGDAGNARDGLYNRLSRREQQQVTVVLRPTENQDLEADFNIVVPWRA